MIFHITGIHHPSKKEISWLVRMSEERFLGFSVVWDSSGDFIEPVLGRRGGQLLWLLHAAAWEQGRSQVVIPDVTIGQAFWGADEKAWPKNWRESIKQILITLKNVEFRNWSITSEGRVNNNGPMWNAVSGYDPTSTLGRSEVCPTICPLHGQTPHHRHFVVGLAPNFVGVLSAWKEAQSSCGSTPRLEGKSAQELLYSWPQFDPLFIDYIFLKEFYRPFLEFLLVSLLKQPTCQS